MLQHLMRLTGQRPMRALRRRLRDRQRQFEARYLQSFDQMRARNLDAQVR